jgi:membrane-bound ClpP family serine protease
MRVNAFTSGKPDTSGKALRRWHTSTLVSPVWFSLLTCLFFACLQVASAQQPNDRPVLLLDIKGAIGFVTVEYLAKALDRAAADHAPAVVVRLDTRPG